MGSIVTIIDSGISSLSDAFKNVIASYKIEKNDYNDYSISEFKDDKDVLGHGTMVADLIYKEDPTVKIISFNICNDATNPDEETLIQALEFIYDKNIVTELINISVGVTYINDYHRLKSICKKLRDRGIILISAFDNDGAISYPAALDSVIGVDVTNDYVNRKNIGLVKNAIVNIIVPNIFYRINLYKKRFIVQGTSFACARITGLISAIITNDKNPKDLLKQISDYVICVDKCMDLEDAICKFQIKKAVLFPVNKESHAVLRFADDCKFDLINIYDERMTGKIGTKLLNYVIEEIDSLDWNSSFDTFILSCYSELQRLTKKDYINSFVYKAKKNNKQIYAFESLEKMEDEDPYFFYPKITNEMVPKYNMKKLHKISMPVVGVYGTSSKQGKFTLQLELIKLLKKMGYQVGHIASEPSGYLFNSDYVFHFGYHAYMNMDLRDCIAILNEMVWKIQMKNKDILITGCQSGSIHYEALKLDDFAIYQYAFTLGTLPDFFILCVNPHDELEYIHQTIKFLDSIDNGKVCAIVIFPVKATTNLWRNEFKREIASENEINKFREYLARELSLPIYLLDAEKDIIQLCKQIVDCFNVVDN